MKSSLTGLLRGLRPPALVRSVYEHLLGTEVEVQVVADTRALGEAAEGAALDEIRRLTAVFNRFDPDSELRRWLAQPGERVLLSPDLREVLALADHWRVRSGGAFHPGADALGAVWEEAARADQRPDHALLERLVHDLHADPWTLHPDGHATLHATSPLGLNALAKGYIVDRAAEAAARSPGVRQVLVNAGGDLRTVGPRGVAVSVADPRTRRDDAPPVARVRVQGGALASSGTAHRGVEIAGQWYSHVIDPRTGQPVTGTAGATVLAPDCATADALATVVGVLPPADALALVETQPSSAALLVLQDGQTRVGTRWPALTSS
ncbi:thiamine biosynthesis lipoprotein [Deinococcus metalli]|uniref:FAD:protein FMN transferase n=1 Tax=Deinococcus metalli TaxID=1141878 RepID=A0A7W8NNZ4_9DEIO|nr:thiamine biosynthesis lipoprotein [Deinococcus metalli]